jgi:hypothetical protein
MLTRRQLTELLLAVPFAARAATPNPPTLCSVNGVNASPGGSLAISPSSGTLPTARVGSVYSASICVSGGTPPYTVTKTADTTTCTWPTASVSGSAVSIGAWPIAVESQTITVQVRDSASNTVSGTYTIPTVSRTGYVPNITALTPVASGTANTNAYAALGVPSMLPGSSYTDPVTGLKVYKVTNANSAVGKTFPAATSSASSWGWCNQYATLGLQISQAWGASLNQYTFFVLNAGAGGGYLIDYTLGGTFSNARVSPAGEGDIHFSRLPGEAQILYYTTHTQLHRYNTATNSLADTGSFPYTWATAGGSGANWLQFNRKHTWATSITATSGANNFTALKIGNTPDSPIADGTVRIVPAGGTGFNEGYSGYNNVCYLCLNSYNPGYTWNLDTNVLTSIPMGSTTGTVHPGTFPGFSGSSDANAGGGTEHLLRINDNATFTDSVIMPYYFGSFDHCGHWTQSAAAAAIWDLTCWWEEGNPSQDSSQLSWNNTFLNVNSGALYTLCGHYSYGTNGTPGYRQQAHTTCSDDGLIVMFSSCMFVGSESSPGAEVELFLVEMPKVAG